jgi:hypothetical protein
MIAEGAIKSKDIDWALERAGVKSSITLEQFAEVLDFVQDAMDGISEDGEDDEDGEASPIAPNAASPVLDFSKDEEETELDSFEEHGETEDEELDLEAALAEAFDELKSPKTKKVSMTAFKGTSLVMSYLSSYQNSSYISCRVV